MREEGENGKKLNAVQTQLTSGRLNPAETSQALPMASEYDRQVNFGIVPHSVRKKKTPEETLPAL